MGLRDVIESGQGFEGPQLPGRTEELDVLRRALEQTKGSQGRTILVSGEAGIGKTTLAEAFTAEARAGGAFIAWGRCWEAGGAPPYWPWIQALRETFASEEAQTALGTVKPFVDVLATLLPEVAGPAPAGGASGLESDHQRFVLFDAVTRVIRAVSADRPFILVLDDLHAADAPSLLLLRFAAKEIRNSRCLVLGAYREREASADPDVRGLLADVNREGETLAIQGLAQNAIAKVLEDSVGAKPTDSLVASLSQITDGNPFYATEIIRLLMKEGRVENRLDFTHKALPVPSNVIDTVLKRVRGLGPEVRHLLDVASVIGREFSVRPLASAAGLDVSEIGDRLDRAIDENVVKRLGHGRYIFDHGLIREALYESLPEQQRAALHGRVGAALEETGVDSSGENLAEIAHHYLRAALDDARAPYEYATRAGRRALGVLAYEQGIGLLEEALVLAPLVGAPPTEISALQRDLGECLLRSGRITEAKEVLEKAAGSAIEAGSPELEAQAVVTYGYVPVEGGVVDKNLIALTEHALRSLGEEPSIDRGLLLNRWGHELMLSGDRRDVEVRDRLSTRGLEMLRQMGDEATIGRALRGRFSVILAPDRMDECMQIADEIVQIGTRLRDEEMQLVGRMRRASVLMILGRAAELDAEYREVQRLAASVKQPLHLSPALFFKACMDGMRFDVSTALQSADAAMAAGPDVPNAMGAHLLQHVSMRLQTDGGADFEPFMRAAMEQRPGIRRTWRAAVGSVLARSGRREEALALLNETVEELPIAPIDSTYMSMLYCATEIVRPLRESTGAEILYEALLPFADQHMVQIMVAPVVYYGSAQLCLGTLASVLERWDSAEEHFTVALREHVSMGARTYLAWTQAEYAEMLHRRGRPDDARYASELLTEATQNARELGLDVLLNFIEKHASAPTVPHGQHAAPISRRAAMIQEGEYVTISYGQEVVRLRSAKGITYLATMLANKDRELHVLDVVTSEPRARQADPELSLGSDDAGPVLDDKAKKLYAARVRELREEIEEADAFNDPGRASRAREEMEFITEQLAGAVGLGGRDRKVASNSERARVNVTKRIKTTIDKIASSAPDLGRHLQATVRTGTYLSYSSQFEPTLEWDLQLDPK